MRNGQGGDTGRRLRVLVVSPTFPYPPSWGSGLRVYHLVSQLSQRHDVTLFCPGNSMDAGYVAKLGDTLVRFHFVPHDRRSNPLIRRLRQAGSLFSVTPFRCSEVHRRSFQRAFDSLISDLQPDIVQLESSLLCLLDVGTGVPVVLDEHNIEYELLERMAESEHSTPRRIFNRVEQHKLSRLERGQWQRAQACAVVSEREARIVRAHAPDALVGVVPNGVVLDAPAAGPSTPDGSTVVFTGLFTYRPNLDAATYLVEEVLPTLVRLCPRVALKLVGHGRTADLARLVRPNVVVTGWVPDITPYLREAAVAVAPLRIGSGTRLKVLEALAMGKGIVSTTAGCEGLEVRHLEHLLIADDAQEFARSIARLLDDPELRSRLGSRGRTLVAEDYSWDKAVESLERLYRQVVDAHLPGRPKPDREDASSAR